MNEGRFYLSDHPLTANAVSEMRRVETTSSAFRRALRVATLEIAFEAARDLATTDVELTTPLATTRKPKLAENVFLVPILRAGLGMLDAALELFSDAKIGFVGVRRDEATRLPIEYYRNVPVGVESGRVFVLDPMLATGESAAAAISILKEVGATRISLLNVVGAPQGVETVRRNCPDVDIYLGALDEGLDERAYITPGLGDAGDRIFNTEAF